MKYLSSLLISLLFFILTYSSASNEFLLKDIVIIVFLLLSVFGIEALVAKLFVKRLFLHNLLLAGFTTINILYVNLIFIEDFIVLSIYAQVLALVVAVFILTTFMTLLDENKRFARVLPVLIVLAIMIILIKPHLLVAPISKASIEPGMTSAKNIRILDFKTKPNVYFISFDSIIPKVLLKKHLGLEATPYHGILDTHFRRFNNFFSDYYSTVRSLSSLLALDREYYSKARKEGKSKYFFSGKIPSPLFEIFKHNGYETNTIYINHYFGAKKGPYVDNYLVSQANLKFGVCQFTPKDGLYSFSYMGYCSLLETEKFRSMLRKLKLDFSDRLDSIDFLIENLKAGLQKKTPQIFLGYLYKPGHTPATFDRSKEGSIEEYREYYLKGSKEAASYLNKILKFIDEEDPDAILYLFGDHGPWISRRDEFATNREFYVQDRFGVYGGIYPSDRCAGTFDAPYNNNFMTVSQGAQLIIKCLSGGEDAFIIQNNYYLPKIENEENRYESYLYE